MKNSFLIPIKYLGIVFFTLLNDARCMEHVVNIKMLRALADDTSIRARAKLQRLVGVSIPENILTAVDASGKTLLHRAALRGNKFAYITFVLLGLDWRMPDRRGQLPAQFAPLNTEDGCWIRDFTSMLQDFAAAADEAASLSQIVHAVNRTGLGSFDRALKIWKEQHSHFEAEAREEESSVEVFETVLEEEELV